MGRGEIPEMPMKQTLVVNTSCPIIEKLKSEDEDKRNTIAKYVYSLAKLSSKKLSADELGEFLSDSYKIISEL